jgi:hypothetical protein
MVWLILRMADTSFFPSSLYQTTTADHSRKAANDNNIHDNDNNNHYDNDNNHNERR